MTSPLTTPMLTRQRWRDLYLLALMESDPSKLVERITAARVAIIERIESTLREPYGIENQAMYGALKALRGLCLRCEAEAQRFLERSLEQNLEQRCSVVWKERLGEGAKP
jgi:hypothetical protein